MIKKICLVGGEDIHKRIPLSIFLINKGFDVTLLGTSNHEFPSSIKYYNYNLVRHFSPISDYKTIHWCRNFFRENKFDLVHTFDTKPAFLIPIALQRTDIPVTRTITGLGTIFMSKSVFSYFLRGVYRILHRKVRNRVFKTIFQNSDDRDMYFKYNLVLKKNCTLIYSSGIDLEEFKEKAKRHNEPYAFICIARLVFEKGIINYLEAAKICKDKGYDYKFLLVGPLEENSKKLNRSILNSYSNDVEILGARKDIKELLLNSDAFVLPTFREGFSRVLLEAAAVGLPIISTNVTGVRDFVSDNEDALLVNPEDSTALADAMVKLASDEDLAKQLVKNALKKVETYSINNVSKQYITIFEEAINDNQK